jgi:hypothetical protein
MYENRTVLSYQNLGVLSNETVIAQVNCPGKSIIDFMTSSPLGMTTTAIVNPSTGKTRICSLPTYRAHLQVSTLSIFFGLLLPISMGHKDFALEQWTRQVSSRSSGVIFLVGITAPNLQQGSASPVGTVFANHTMFSIQSQLPMLLFPSISSALHRCQWSSSQSI